MHSKFEYILALFQEGKTEKAKKECLKVLKNESDNFDILHLLGIILFNEKKFDLSIEYIQKAIKINPNNAEANNNLGIALKEINKFELSLISFQRAIKIDPNYEAGSLYDANSRIQSSLLSLYDSYRLKSRSKYHKSYL